MDPLDPTLEVTVGSNPDGTPVLALAGQLDLATAASLEDAFTTLETPGTGPVDVVIDMRDLTFMDSTGLTVLLLAVRRGYAVRLRQPRDLIRRLVALTGLSETLPIEP